MDNKTYRHSKWQFLVRPFESFLSYQWERMELTAKGVTITKGLNGRKSLTIPYNKINNVVVKQGLLSVFLHVGDISILAGNDLPEIFRCVKNPKEVAHLILDGEGLEFKQEE